MTTARHHRHPIPPTGVRFSTAFTLVELLVVVAIIALLIAILLPSLNKARESAKGIKCAANFRQVGIAQMTFAMEHDQRYPGFGSQSVGGSLSWHGVLNNVYFKSNIMIRISTSPAPANKIGCPSFKPMTIAQPRHYIMNYFAGGQGGTGITGDHTILGQYATAYTTGSRVDFWRRPSYQYLVIESEKGSDLFSGAGTAGLVVMADSSAYPEYAANSGSLTFRHLLTGNFLFMDGHVEIMKGANLVGTDMNSNARFYNY